MNHWLLKTEPSDYCYDDLVRDKRTVWDGVTNNQALQFMREIKKGDRAFIYHTGNEKAIVGVATVTRGAYPDPEADDDKIVVFDIAPNGKAPSPVTLAQIKKDKSFADFHLVRNSRLSVMPVPPALWKKLCSLADVSDS
jgi:predicted RNA-binding protein with PUA-like domain